LLRDLEWLAEKQNMGIDDIIELHSGKDYFAYATGFAPGFCYLGTVDERLATPRLVTPRANVPPGSVADSRSADSGLSMLITRGLAGHWQLPDTSI
jgi:allophanate hydrolase subunit 1